MTAIDMEKTAFELALSEDMAVKKALGKKILNAAYESGVYPSSIHEFYMAYGKGKVGGFTVPATNLRGMTYPLARAMFRVAKRNKCGAFIFELAKSEIKYTAQPPVEYTSMVLAAAIKEGYRGPVFIQADHVQISEKKFKANPDQELNDTKNLISEQLEAGFYNIDIDSSTLVDLTKPDLNEQQRLNYEICAKLTEFIRQKQPRGIEVSVGGEIGEVGGKNSTKEELEAFMEGYRRTLRKGLTGISKISVQTGTRHGGLVLPDGSIAKVNLDFETLGTLSKISRDKYGLAGAVQHGASTLPVEMFNKFPEVGTAEVHLATDFQNMIYDSKHFPGELKAKVYTWIKTNLGAQKKEGETEEQFFYKSRKTAFGPFKRDILGLRPETRDAIVAEIEGKFDLIFKKLNCVNNKELVDRFTTLKRSQ